MCISIMYYACIFICNFWLECAISMSLSLNDGAWVELQNDIQHELVYTFDCPGKIIFGDFLRVWFKLSNFPAVANSNGTFVPAIL